MRNLRHWRVPSPPGLAAQISCETSLHNLISGNRPTKLGGRLDCENIALKRACQSDGQFDALACTCCAARSVLGSGKSSSCGRMPINGVVKLPAALGRALWFCARGFRGAPCRLLCRHSEASAASLCVDRQGRAAGSAWLRAAKTGGNATPAGEALLSSCQSLISKLNGRAWHSPQPIWGSGTSRSDFSQCAAICTRR